MLRKCPRRPAGYTLLETIVVFALATGMVFVAVRLLSAVSTVRMAAQAETQTFRDLSRFADRLRDDAHAATQVRQPGNARASELVIEQGERRVRYRIVDSAIRRTEHDESTDNVISREGYRLPDRVTATWNVDPDTSLIQLQTQSENARIPEFSMEAVFAREAQP